MLKISRFLCAGLLLALIGTGSLFSQTRYALVIGNGNYRNKEISSLANPVNDATDMAAVLRELGYNVSLKTNIGLVDMMDSIQEFSYNLKRSAETEGFFWFAGHGLSVRGIHYLLPVDVDPMNDSIIARGSYSVNDLMEEIEYARNKTNLIVIDACRNTILPGTSRSVGTRGLSVLASDDYRIAGNKIIYSTMVGKTAADGIPGSRNSPFAQAFISNIKNPELFDDVFLDIANETMRLTNGQQQPYALGSFAVKSYSIVNKQQSGAQPAQTAATVPDTSVETARVNPGAPKEPKDPGLFMLDNHKVFSLFVSPVLYNLKFTNGVDGSFTTGANLRLNFYEQYRNYGQMFVAPNSIFFSADIIFSKILDGQWLDLSNTESVYMEESLMGGVFGLGTGWKIRLGTSQRFIANFGLSFEFFVVRDKGLFKYIDTSFFYDEMSVDFKEFMYAPGIGLHGGLGFRFTKSLSLDLAMVFKAPFIGFKYDKDLKFTIFGGVIGLTLWFPR